MRRIVLSVLLSSLVAACGGGGGGSGGDGSTPAVTPPSSLSYNDGNTVTAEVGTQLTTLDPTVVGTVTSYSVSPSLPDGLALSMTTGAISGTPTAETAEATYTVTASNSGGHTTFGLHLVVNPAAPTGLSYSAAPLVAEVGHVIVPMIPTVTGSVTSYYSVPAPLPSGLFLDPVSGVISGTPRVTVAASTPYSITAHNVTGDSVFVLHITVSAATTTNKTGILRGSVIEGVSYQDAGSSTANGLTDGLGHFGYDIGDNVTMSIGSATLGTATAGPLLTSVDFFQPGGNGQSTNVLNLERFLMMLDKNNDTTDGIQISPQVQAAAAGWASPNFASPSFDADVASDIADANTADNTLVHALPTAQAAEDHLKKVFLCSYSGGFIGSYAATSGNGDNGRFAAEISPDGTMEVIGYSSVDAVGLGFDGLQPNLVTTTSAVSLLLDKTFSVSDSPVLATGSFLDPDNIAGTWTITGTGAAAGTFTGARLPAADSAKYRFTGDFEDHAAPDVVLGMLVLDWDGSTNTDAVSGYAFQFDNGHLVPVSGTIDASNNFTGTIHEPTPIAITGTYTPGSVFLDSHYVKGSATYDLISDGCKLN